MNPQQEEQHRRIKSTCGYRLNQLGGCGKPATVCLPVEDLYGKVYLCEYHAGLLVAEAVKLVREE